MRMPVWKNRPVLAITFAWIACSTPVSADSTPASLTPPITIYHDAARYNTFPDVKALPDGRLLCVFRDAVMPERVTHIEPDARIVGSVSDDHGRTWSAPKVIYDDPQCQNDPSVTVLRDGRLLLTFFTWEGLSEAEVDKGKSPLARRVDHGDWGVFAQLVGVHLLQGDAKTLSWHEPAKVRHLAGSPNTLRATSSSILETDKGTLLLPIYGRTPAHMTDRAYVLRSDDGGRSWSDEQLIAADPEKNIAMQEPALAQMPNGDIICLMRTAKAGDHLYTVHSSDDGKTWSEPVRTPLVGHPADLQVLPDGKLLATFGYRHKPFGVRACVSADGKTWNADDVVVITAEGAHFDLGYPSVCLTADDHVLIAYYINAEDIRDRWIECQRIPMSVFTSR